MILYEALLKLRDKPELDFVSVILDHCSVGTEKGSQLSFVKWDTKARRYKINISEPAVARGVECVMRDITHEVLHIVYNHFDDKYKTGEVPKWNQAMDCVINSNPFLQADPEWIKNVHTFQSLTGGRMNAQQHTSKDIYNWLLQNEPEQEKPQQDDHSQMNGSPDPDKPGDEPNPNGQPDPDKDGDQEGEQPDGGQGDGDSESGETPEPQEQDQNQQDDRPKSLVEMLGEDKAAEVAKGVGTKEVLDEVKHIIEAAKGESMRTAISRCLKRGNVRRVNMLKPTMRPLSTPFGRKKTKNKLALVIDTSGSMVCDPAMLEIIQHTFNECKKIGEVEVFMGDCSQGAHHKKCRELPPLVGGGGSDFGWLKDIEADQLIFVTDGYITDDKDVDVCSLAIVKGNKNLQTKARQVRV